MTRVQSGSVPLVRPIVTWSSYPQAAWWGLGLALLFILYETTLPWQFRFSWAQMSEGWQRATLLPFQGQEGEPASRADLIGNIPLFAPLGFFLSLTPVLRRSGWWRPLLITTLGTATSLAVEFLQLFSPLRYAQTTDLITNTIGTLLGVLLAWTIGRDLFDRTIAWALEKLQKDPAVLGVAILTAIIFWGSLLPLDLSIRWVTIKHHLLEAQWSLAADWPREDRLALTLALIKHAWLFAFWGAAVAHVAGRRRQPLLRLAAWGAALAVVTELSQLFVLSQTVSVVDATVAWCGAIAGGATLLAGHRLGLSNHRLAVCYGAGYVIYLVSDSISPLAPLLVQSLTEGGLPEVGDVCFVLVPFRNAENLPTVTALGEWSARLLRFVPLGATLQLGLPRFGVRLVAASMAGACVLLLAIFVGRFSRWPAESTEVILAWLGIGVGWYIGVRLSRYLRSNLQPTNPDRILQSRKVT